MKTIAIRKFADGLTTLSLLGMALNAPVREGVDVAGIRRRIRVCDAVEAAEKGGAENLALEDADFATLCEVWKATPWTIPNRHIVTVDDDLTAAGK